MGHAAGSSINRMSQTIVSANGMNERGGAWHAEWQAGPQSFICLCKLACPGLVSHVIVPMRADRCGIQPQSRLAQRSLLKQLFYFIFIFHCQHALCACAHCGQYSCHVSYDTCMDPIHQSLPHGSVHTSPTLSILTPRGAPLTFYDLFSHELQALAEKSSLKVCMI